MPVTTSGHYPRETACTGSWTGSLDNPISTRREQRLVERCRLALSFGRITRLTQGGLHGVGAGAGVSAWVITVLASRTASGQLTASVTNADTYLPYLAVAACCAAIVIYATRPQRGLQ